ncbi:Uncharacterised protein [Gordonia paraffinivorans]|uniref:WXG100 family type VII secretion target n=1 Tax=Gordonia paraffinivorans TaxID=175628 RepID=A0ABD7V0Y6_9ACTN|nr:WXG100 family type VII secretion target [Gordonia paraffinivorans]VFA87977.1 Uncharacterised protein [Gordonia paraffinivorans]
MPSHTRRIHSDITELAGAESIIGSPAAGASGGSAWSVDTAGGQASVASIKTIVSDMQAVVDRIARATDNSTASKQESAGRWVGALTETHADWNSAAIRMNNLLGDIKNALGFNFDDRDDADAAAGSAFGAPGSGTLV